MNRIIFSKLILILYSIIFSFTIKSYGQKQDYSKNEVIKVLDEIRSSIEVVHPNPYHSTSKQNIDSIQKSLVQNLPDQLSEIELYKVLLPIVNSFNDGHIQLPCPFGKYLNKGLNNGKGLFPFTLYQNNDDVFIKISVFDEIVKPGYQLVSIDNKSIGSIIDDYSRYKHSDNLVIRKSKVVDDFTALDFFANRGKDSYLIGYKRSKNDSVQFCTINSAKIKDIIKFNRSYKPNNTEYFSNSIIKLPNLIYLQLHPSKNVALLTLPSFDISKDQELVYKEKIDSVFSILNARKIDTLLIDIRNNEGGRDYPSLCILDYIATNDYSMGKAYLKRSLHQKKLYEEILKEELSDSSYLKSPEYNNYFLTNDGSIVELDSSAIKVKNRVKYNGKVFVLIGSKTFSAALTFASTCKCYNFATLIGEETFGRTSTYTSLVPIQLSIPNITLMVAHRMVKNACSQGFNYGLTPDIEIKRTHDDYLNGKDSVIEYFLNVN
ncbi:S41 family peptidase [Tenuifilum osseticum]|uniref:S41 family peptidase n=1 Tax=Tenuifilum osseticum TaxID=3374723 RepID=UPI0034E3E07C